LSSSDFGEGDVLAEKYRIEAVLGEGGMGIVLRAMHMELGCPVAIKVMRPELAHNEDAVNRLLVEARAAASIRSEHVARVLDVGRLETGAPFLVLEHLEGRDLAQIIQRSGRLAVQVAVDFVLQACQALSEAHSAGIIHRDLKPENLFLSYRADGTPVIKILDFGISKRLTHDGREAARTNPSELLGSPLYMAPEQMKGGASVDARADIWSLGVCLYELCTGQSPFFGESIPSICARVIGVDPKPPRELIRDLPAGLEAVILRCLNRDPELRPSNVAELATELAQYGSADGTAYANSARLVMAGARTNPTVTESMTHSPSSERIALSETLAVLGQGLRVRHARHFRPRASLIGAALACTTMLGGSLVWRSSQAHEVNAAVIASAAPIVPIAPQRDMNAPIEASTIQDAQKNPVELPHPDIVLASSAAKSVLARPVSAATRHVVPKRVAKPARNAWDPKSFGGRL
jgi:serine/threonine-protein kinase